MPPLLANEAPSREIEFQEIEWDWSDVSGLSPYAMQAMAIDPEGWSHAETENYIIHFRRITEARKVARRIEHDLWYVAKSLGFGPEDYRQKSHAFIFEDAAEWRRFARKSEQSEWMAAMAVGDELYLNVRSERPGEGFDEVQLAHETAHAVVARLYKNPWPLWLNEGFAGYMETASVAARRGRYLEGLREDYEIPPMPLEVLVRYQEIYPIDEMELMQFYNTSQRLVRFLMEEHESKLFPELIERIVNQRQNPLVAMAEIYGSDYPDAESFARAFREFDR